MTVEADRYAVAREGTALVAAPSAGDGERGRIILDCDFESGTSGWRYRIHGGDGTWEPVPESWVKEVKGTDGTGWTKALVLDPGGLGATTIELISDVTIDAGAFELESDYIANWPRSARGSRSGLTAGVSAVPGAAQKVLRSEALEGGVGTWQHTRIVYGRHADDSRENVLGCRRFVDGKLVVESLVMPKEKRALFWVRGGTLAIDFVRVRELTGDVHVR